MGEAENQDWVISALCTISNGTESRVRITVTSFTRAAKIQDHGRTPGANDVSVSLSSVTYYRRKLANSIICCVSRRDESYPKLRSECH